MISAPILFALISVLSFVIIYKAVTLPLTFDEVVTWDRYTTNTSIPNVILAADGSSNNHILNSLSIKVCQFILGDKPWALRLPNVLSFFLFVISVIALAKRYFEQSLLLLCLPLICVFLNPYLIDFFSLARGYGMANAFMACSISCLLLFSSGRQMKWYCLTILFAMLAAYSNFTFLIFWAAINILLSGMLVNAGFVTIPVKRAFAITGLLAISFAALCYFPLKNMQQCIQSTFGDHTGFFYDTLLSETNRFNYGVPLPGLTDKILSMMVCIIGLLSGLNFVLKLRKDLRSALTDPFNLVFILLLLVWALNMLQIYCFNTSYLSGRTALIYYLMFVLVLVFFVRDIAAKNLLLAQIASGLLSLLLLWHFAVAINLNSVYEWSFDAYTYDVMNTIESYKQQHPETKKIELNLTSFLHPSFSFYVKTKNLPWFILANPQSSNIDTTSQTLFYYTIADHVAELKNYSVVKRFKPNGILLPIVNAGHDQVLLMHK